VTIEGRLNLNRHRQLHRLRSGQLLFLGSCSAQRLHLEADNTVLLAAEFDADEVFRPAGGAVLVGVDIMF
jgi:hypothetical protein